jgi:hypothetical protein
VVCLVCSWLPFPVQSGSEQLLLRYGGGGGGGARPEALGFLPFRRSYPAHQSLIAAVLFLVWGILGDLYIHFRLNAGADPFTSFRDMFITGLLNALAWVITVVDISFPFMFFIELPLMTYALASLATLVTGALGGAVGYGLGARIRAVLG